VWNHGRGYAWERALPAGYELSVAGVVLFMMGGAGDLLWHEIFGVELALDAAFSPSHILLVVGVTLIVSGPLRAGWYRAGEPRGLAEWGPVVASLAFTLAVLTVITQWLHPFVGPWSGTGSGTSRTFESNTGLVAAGVWVQTAFLMGVVLFGLRRWLLPFGSLTFVFTLCAALMSVMRDEYRFVLVALVAGLFADLLVMWLRPSVERVAALRAFSFLVPLVLYSLFFVMVIVTEGISWSVHMWTGTAFIAGMVGLLLSFLVAPLAVPSSEYRVPSTEYRVPSTEYRVPSTEYRVPSTEYRVPSSE
jgi:hypothetical protein